MSINNLLHGIAPVDDSLSLIIPVAPIMARYSGIAMIELGVEITVMAVMVSIFFDLVTAGDHEAVLERDHD